MRAVARQTSESLKKSLLTTKTWTDKTFRHLCERDRNKEEHVTMISQLEAKHGMLQI